MRTASVLKVVNALQEGALNKKDIQSSTNISWGSCSDIISQLQDYSLIVPAKQQTPANGKGRKATFFEFGRNENLLLAMEIQPYEINCALVNFGNENLKNLTFTIDNVLNANSLLSAIESAYHQCLSDFEIDTRSVIALIFSLTGAVDTQEGIWLKTPHIPGIRDFHFEKLKERIPELQYVLVNHDINDRARAILRSNDWDDSHYVFAHVSHGIGLAIQNEQGFYQGHRGFAGEIGHIPYPGFSTDGAHTLEQRLSVSSILRFVKEDLETPVERFDDLYDHPVIENYRLLQFISEPLMFMCIAVVNLYDPQTLILGGKALEPFYPGIQSYIEEELTHHTWLGGPEKIKWYREDNTNCAYGAALNASSQVLEWYIKGLDL